MTIQKDNTRNVPETSITGMLKYWKQDFLAAISVSLVALPLALGVAVASGVEPIAGLISAIIGGLVVTLYRGSYVAINGPAAGLIAVILSATMSLDDGTGQAFNYVIAATVIAGGLQVLLGLFKLGYIAESIPSSVIQGIMVAIGIIIFTSQIYVALGVAPDPGNTVEKLTGVWSKLPEANFVILLISLIGLLLLIYIPRMQSRILNFLPASLWVLIVSIPLVYLFNFMEPHTANLFGKSFTIVPEFLIDLPDDLTKAIVYPNFDKIGTLNFWITVLSITLIASIQTLAMAKAVDKLDPYKRKTNLNKDLIGVGIGTMVSGAIGGLPIITVVVRSTVNITNNGKTRMSNFYHGLLLILFLFVLAPVIQMIPYAALAAILVYIGFRLASPSTFKKIYGQGIEQLIFMVVTIVITLYSNLLWGIIGGTSFALMLQILLARLPIGKFFKESLNPDTSLYITKEGTYDLNVRGVANFLSIPKLGAFLKEIPAGANVKVDLHDTRLVGLSYLEKLYDFRDSHQDTGGTIEISGMEDHVSSSVSEKALKISLTPNTVKLSPRQLRLQSLAEDNGYSFDNKVSNNVRYLRNFKFFEFRPIERKSNSLRGNILDSKIEWESTDVIFNEGASFTAEIFFTTLMYIQLPKSLPSFILEKEGLFEKLLDRVIPFQGFQDIDIKDYPRFSDKFLLLGNDVPAIKNFFKGDIIKFLEDNSTYHIESDGKSLLIFNKIKLARTDETQKLLRFGEGLAKVL